MNSLISAALEYIVTKYNPHTVILYGSYARGDFTSLSDIDIACFCEIETASKDARLFRDSYLDLWIYPTSTMTNLTDDVLRFHGGKLLLDKGGQGEKYLKLIDEIIKNGPPKRSDADQSHTREWVKKMLLRIENGAIDNINEEINVKLDSSYRKLWLQFELLEIYFQLNDMWFLGHKSSFRYLQEHDPDIYDLFCRAYLKPDDAHQLRLLANRIINMS